MTLTLPECDTFEVTDVVLCSGSAEVTDLKHQPESPTSLQLSWMFPVLNAKEHLRHYVIEVLDPLTSGCLYGVLLSNPQVRTQ